MQAKGLEDTTFYRQCPLASLNEVGGDPSRFGNSPSAFHALNVQRLTDWPGGLSTTATHDTKRGEDARIRINVISELAEEWRDRLARWSRWNARKKSKSVNERPPTPARNICFYQTLIGAWPFGGPDDAPPEGFVERVQGYMVKAAREAKRNTSWTDPDPSYMDALASTSPTSSKAPTPPVPQRFPAVSAPGRAGRRRPLARPDPLKLVSPGVRRHLPGLRALGLQPGRSRQPPARRLRHRKRLLADLIRGDLAAGRPRARSPAGSSPCPRTARSSSI